MEDRKTYIDKISARLKEWDDEIRKLEARADILKADTKANFREQIEELNGKKDEAQKKLNQIREADEEAWQELKEGIVKSWETLSDSIKSSLEKFK
jgi:hypothetical protein